MSGGQARRLAAVAEDIVREVLWRARPVEGPVPEPSWPIDPAQLREVEICWPASYPWPNTRGWMESLTWAMRRLVRVRTGPVAQPYTGVVLWNVAVRGRVHPVAIDFSDYSAVNAQCVEAVPLYFKMQFAEGGYPWGHVVPGGFVPRENAIYDFLGPLRALRDRRRFRYEVYGRFGAAYAAETRQRAVEMLRRQSRFRYEGSFGIIRYSRYLREVAAAKVCVNLPGNGDLCFRLIDYMAVGACIIGPRPRVRLHRELVEGRHVVYTKDDLSDLVDLCERYLQDDDAREALCRESRDFFDRYLHRAQLARYYVYTCLERLT